MENIYDPFRKFGLGRVINAATCLTRLGGSMPHPEVFRAMEDASKAYVNIPVLKSWAGERIREALGTEAGLPTAGASNAILLAAAACIMKETELEHYNPLEPQTWSKIAQRLPMHTENLKTEFIVQKSNRNEYDHAVECAGGRMVEVGSEDGTSIEELNTAFNPNRTAAYYYTFSPSGTRLSLKTLTEIAHSKGVPVIVDAAPYLTHKVVPGKLISEGADLMIFSGGKQLGGPNNTGILAGRKDLVKLAYLQSYPFDGIGRSAKMSREAIVGLVKALELFMERNDNDYYKVMEEKTRRLSEKLNEIPGVSSGVIFEPTAVEDILGSSYAFIELEDEAGISLKQLYLELLQGTPSIETLLEPYFIIPDSGGKITIKVEHLLEGDEQIIIHRVKSIIENARV